MVYYSPYKQVWKAFIRAIRTFISTLFSKRLLLMIIVALIIMLLQLNTQVRAESIYQDGYAYRNIKYNGLDTQTNTYSWDYRIYISSGLKEGTITITQEMYNRNHWILWFDGSRFRLLFFVNNSDLYLKKSNGSMYLSNYSSRTRIEDFGFYLSSTGETFTFDGGPHSYNNQYQTSLNFIEPNSIIATKDLTVRYYDDSTYIGSPSDLSDNRILKTSQIRLFDHTGFRLYLNDFEPFSSVEDEDWDFNYSSVDTVTLYFSVWDINNNTYPTELTQLQLQDYDEDGKLYVDIPFSNLQYMNILDGDYILLFAIYLDNTKTMNNSSYGYSTKYSTIDYYRYTYYSQYDAGILKSVYDTDGEEKENQSQVITGNNNNNNNNTNENLILINNMTNSINNQTTIIQEQTNTINDMSDFMQDDSFSSDSITNNMPSSGEFQDVTENGFDNIFTTLRNTFTSDNYQDVEFVVPFSNGQKITIPSNLTENIIPTAIKTLIQMVYWYFIARFIVKDIASYIEKAKSGDIFNSSDTNIKTDML